MQQILDCDTLSRIGWCILRYKGMVYEEVFDPRHHTLHLFSVELVEFSVGRVIPNTGPGTELLCSGFVVRADLLQVINESVKHFWLPNRRHHRDGGRLLIAHGS